MEEVFIDHLDQIYWQGYGEASKKDNPDAFYQQLAEFTETCKIPKRECGIHKTFIHPKINPL